MPCRFNKPAVLIAICLGAATGHTAEARQAAEGKTASFRVPVLMYHRVCALSAKEKQNAITADLTVPPEQFELQVQTLQKAGFTFLKASEVADAVIHHTSLPARSVCITLDDGYEDNYTVAMPILQKYHATATIFVITKAVGAPGHVSWAGLKAMQAAGIEVQSHTVSHPDLPSLHGKGLDNELQSARKTLETRLNCPITTLAYPAGRYSDEVVERTRAAGYLSAWKKNGGMVTPTDNVFLLPRVRVMGAEKIQQFERSVGIKKTAHTK
jgi:peptidoglycan/xylan/chitin deacetylase (PgdA/CDA1 family)